MSYLTLYGCNFITYFYESNVFFKNISFSRCKTYSWFIFYLLLGCWMTQTKLQRNGEVCVEWRELLLKWETWFLSGHFNVTSIRMQSPHDDGQCGHVAQRVVSVSVSACASWQQCSCSTFSPLLSWVKLWDWEIYHCGHWMFHILQPFLATSPLWFRLHHLSPLETFHLNDVYLTVKR